MSMRIFEQKPIRRAGEIGPGVAGPGRIPFFRADAASRDSAACLIRILAQGEGTATTQSMISQPLLSA
jgi:hypothetical protein